MNSAFIYSLGMTLLHSLWQVLLVYLVMKLSLKVLKSGSSLTRYRISAGSLFLVLVMALSTFLVYFTREKTGVNIAGEVNGSLRDFSVFLGQDSIGTAGSEPVLDKYNIISFFVLIYFLGVGIMTLRFAGSLLYIERYRHRGIIHPGEQLLHKFEELLTGFRIKRKVRLAESLIAKTPMVIGYFKPMIIIPAGLFTQLPFNQVEAILNHELAHIKRNDFLVNIIQSIVELIFFYHPAIYLISKEIRNERENCCDDLALSYCSDSSYYIRALASLEGIGTLRPSPAVAFTEKRNNLLNRMKRILKKENMKTKLSDRIIAGLIILAGSGILLIAGAAALENISGEHSAADKEPMEKQSAQKPEIHSPLKDTIVDYGEDHIITSRQNQKGETETIEVKFDKGKISELKIDGKLIPRENYKDYKALIADIRSEVARASREVEKAESELEKIDEEEIERKVEKALQEAKSIDREEIEREIEEARAELEELDEEEIREEVRKAIVEAQREIERARMEDINWDSIRIEVDKALQEIDWEEIGLIVEKSLEESKLSEEEMEMIMEDVNRAMEQVNWEEIEESVHYGLEAARYSLEEIQWDVLLESIEMSLNITADVMNNISSELDRAFEEMDEVEKLDVKEEIEAARKQVKKEKEKLEKLDKSMEEALRELEEE